MIRILADRLGGARMDSTYGRPELISARDAARRKDLFHVSSALAGELDPNVRADIAYVAAEELVRRHGAELPEWIDGWLTSSGDDAYAWMLRGTHEVLRAWKVRGYQRAAHTKSGSFRSFWEILGDAEAMCRRAAHLAPEDPTPWVLLVHMARGQQVGVDQTVERFAEVVARCDTHLRGNEQLVLSLSPKWGTPVGVLQRFVENQYRSVPIGSPVRMNLVQVYIERWFNLPSTEKQAFVNRSTVRKQAERTISNWLDHGNVESQQSLHNFAAFWYTITGQHSLARPHFEASAEYVKEFPWSYMAFPVRSYRQGRRAALRG
ncbi:hypothetical protein P3T36_005405 [Kitasatospora sp. MAP12-15]|uniref:hypothetical protein n=1 Tax=unclassified Kitasatospora TaxID=2633591 RepID=UPI002475684A|nr:hypothetical protein [Kitasatospora sp. MAP12-44]MDH6109794.1 hypothetical protein [Kitasatospora sp. MAP12-44]